MKCRAAFLPLLFFAGHAYARMSTVTVAEMAEACDVAFTGKVTKVDKETATIQIEKVLRGKIEGAAVTVTPVGKASDVGDIPNFREGESVLVFGTQAAGKPVTVLDHGQGKISLTPETGEAMTASISRLLEITAIKDREAMERAMLAAAGDAKETPLRAMAQQFVQRNLSKDELPTKYKKELAALLNSEDATQQRTALDTLRFVHEPANLPRIIELSKSKDKGVVDSASLALGRYDEKESAAALIALTRDPRPEVRVRAAIDLSNSHVPEAKDALAVLLKDKETSVRAMAPRGLVFLLRDGKADDLIPQVAALLKDPEADVRIGAARALAEPRDTAAITPLLDALADEKAGRELTYVSVQSLYSHYTKGGAAAQAIIDKRIDLIIAALKNDTSTSGFGPAMQAIGILKGSNVPAARTAVEWAAASHPNLDVRGYAKQ